MLHGLGNLRPRLGLILFFEAKLRCGSEILSRWPQKRVDLQALFDHLPELFGHEHSALLFVGLMKARLLSAPGGANAASSGAQKRAVAA